MSTLNQPFKIRDFKTIHTLSSEYERKCAAHGANYKGFDAVIFYYWLVCLPEN